MNAAALLLIDNWSSLFHSSAAGQTAMASISGTLYKEHRYFYRKVTVPFLIVICSIECYNLFDYIIPIVEVRK